MEGHQDDQGSGTHDVQRGTQRTALLSWKRRGNLKAVLNYLLTSYKDYTQDFLQRCTEVIGQEATDTHG